MIKTIFIYWTLIEVIIFCILLLIRVHLVKHWAKNLSVRDIDRMYDENGLKEYVMVVHKHHKLLFIPEFCYKKEWHIICGDFKIEKSRIVFISGDRKKTRKGPLLKNIESFSQTGLGNIHLDNILQFKR